MSKISKDLKKIHMNEKNVAQSLTEYFLWQKHKWLRNKTLITINVQIETILVFYFTSRMTKIHKRSKSRAGKDVKKEHS